MTLFQDSFSRSGVLDGSLPDVGDGTARWLTSSAGVQCNGAQVVIPAAGWAALAVGAGDADLTAQAVTSPPGPGIFVRSPGPGAGGWRLENYAQTYSTGYYETRPNYIGQYKVGGIQVDSRDQGACPALGSLSNVSQCGNSNFASSYTQACGSWGSNVTYYLQGVYQSGTCQVYVPGSYTVYFSQLINPAGTVVWQGQTAYAPVLRLRAQGSTIAAYVNGTQVATATDADQASRLRTRHGLYSSASQVGQFEFINLDTLNTAPNAPVITAPANNSVVDRTSAVTLAWSFNDPDPGDTQSKYDLQFRKVGSSTWTPATRETPTTSHSLAANTLDDGAQYEWQVRTYDSQGVVGPWSSTSYFRAGTPPPPPTWVAPINGGQIPTEQFIARWSSASQVAYELQVYADASGSPDLAAGPLFTTGTVTSNAREQQLTFSTNNVTRHLRLRIQAGGLWSQWSTARATVSYTPPPTTVVNTLPDDERGCIIVDLRTPAPTGTQPAVLFCDVYRKVDTAAEERVATRLDDDGRWIDWTPTSGAVHRYRAVAFGANGVTSTSEPTA